MKIVKCIILWIIIGFLSLLAFGSIPSFAWIPSVLIAVLIAPIDKWQNFLRKYIKGFLKVILIVVLVIVMFILLPTSDATTDTSHDNTATSESTNTTEDSITESNGETIGNTNDDTPTDTSEDITEDTTESTTINTHTHTFSAATCTSPKTCSCGATEGTANGHKWKDATYTSPKKCSICGATEGSPADVPGKENYHGHVYTGGSTSKKYHYEQACPGKNSHEITWEEVESRGLEPCGTCVLK